MIQFFLAAFLLFPTVAFAAGELKGIREIEIHIENQSPDGYSLGVTNDVFRKIVTEKVKRVGLTVSQGGNCPTLYVTVSTMKLPGEMFAYSYRVQLMETVTPVGRLVPEGETPANIDTASTWISSGMAASKKREFSKAIQARVGEAVDRFVSAYSNDNPKALTRR